MEKIVKFFRSKTGSVLLILLGVGLTLFFGLRAAHAFRHMPPFSPPKSPETDDGIRSWMNLKYVAKVYGVPSDYLIRYLEIPPGSEEIRRSLDDLNRELALGNTENGDPLIITRLEFAILEFHAHPRFRETQEVRPTMSIHFIATETRIPENYLFDQIRFIKEGNEYKSLDLLSQEQNYVGGWETLTQDVQTILDTYQSP